MRPKYSISQFLAANAPAEAKPLEVKAAADGGVEVYLYDVIDAFFGVSAKMIADALSQAKGKPVTLRINSPGGDVFEGRAIATLVRGHGAPVKAVVDGLAASAATTVAIAANTVEMAAGSFFMIHRAWAFTVGNKNDLTELAALLDKIDGELAADYARKSGASAKDMLAAMDAETWYTAEEALASKLVDSVAEAPAAFKNFNLAAFDRVPDALKARLAPPAKAEEKPAVDWEAARAHAERRVRVL